MVLLVESGLHVERWVHAIGGAAGVCAVAPGRPPVRARLVTPPVVVHRACLPGNSSFPESSSAITAPERHS